jgi:Hemerythrin HHE cation binding domain
MDLWQLIGSYRANILELADEVAGAVGGGTTGRKKLFRALHGELERYMDAMENVIHPVLAGDPRTYSYVADLEQEHAEIRRHMDDLAAAAAKDSREWTRRFRALVFALEHYFALQEHGAFTVARGTLGPEAQALRRAFAREQIGALQAQRWHLPRAMAPGRYGVSTGTALGLVLGVLTLAVAAIAWRRPSSSPEDDPWALKRRSQSNRADREQHAAFSH